MEALITLKIKNEAKQLSTADFLLPLNGLINLTDALQKFDENIIDGSDYYLLNTKLSHWGKFNVRKNIDDKFISISRISKESPAVVELLINAAPYILSTLSLVIDRHEDTIIEDLIVILNESRNFRPIPEEEKRRLTRKVLQWLKWILNMASINVASKP